MSIQHKTGDMFKLLPKIRAMTIIAHVCNDIGGWGSGFVVPLGKTWPQTESRYRSWHRVGLDPGSGKPFELGQFQMVIVNTGSLELNQGPTVVANMIGQHKTLSPGYIPIRYGAIAQCLKELAEVARIPKQGVEFHCPAFGTGLAGGNKQVIESLIEEYWSDFPVTIYSL